ncbi:hypothetical protein Ac2012v2_008139 [Leucoagaricus gongylophorus]
MTHQRSSSENTISGVLTCTSETFHEIYSGPYNTGQLVSDAKKSVLNRFRADLESNHSKCNRYKLLMAMLDHAPTDSGRRYVATVLAIAGTKGVDAVTEAADQWLEHMFFKMLSISRATTTQPTRSFTPTLDNTAQRIEKADRTEQKALRESVQRRERDRCAITGAFDSQVALTLMSQELPFPSGLRQFLEAAHIIPLSLNGFDKNRSSELREAAITWDMLRSWTGIDLGKLVGSKINTPENTILMCRDQHLDFGRYRWYLDKDAYPDNPNKYKAQGSRSNYRFTSGEATRDVEFLASAESMVKPPDPEIIRIHAAFARVLSLSGAIDYFDKVELSAEQLGGLSTDGTSDLELLLTGRLAQWTKAPGSSYVDVWG